MTHPPPSLRPFPSCAIIPAQGRFYLRAGVVWEVHHARQAAVHLSLASRSCAWRRRFCPCTPPHSRAVARGDGRADIAVGVPAEDVGDSAANAGAVNVFYSGRYGISDRYNRIWDQDDLWGDSDAETFDAFGFALAAGDFDGDGWDDLAVGVPQEDVLVGSYLSNAGIVQVLYGGPAGLSTAGLQAWCQGGCDGLRDTAEDGDQFGYALAAGDFNADGYDDLAVGVPYEDIDTITDAGAVNVVYGSPTGLSILAVDDQFWNQDSPYVEGGCEAWDRFGTTLAAGDFDGDGWDDLAIGVPFEDVGATADAGAVNILYGSTYGLASVGDQIFDQGDLQGGVGENDIFAYALAAGRLGGDSYDDLAVGVRNEDAGGVSASGAVNIIYGALGGLSTANNQYYDQGSLENSPAANDFFGSALAIGDLDGDGYGDLAVGVPREDIDGEADAGGINVIFGTASRLSVTGNVFWCENDVVDGMSVANEQAGYSLAAGDLDDDGDDELVVGVPYQEIGGVFEAGAIDVIYGFDPWPGGGYYGWSQDSGSVQGMCELEDHFGMSLAIGDFRGFRTYAPTIIQDRP